MSDLSFQLLSQVINQTSWSDTVLWVVDENVSAHEISLIKPDKHLVCVTNRCDIYRQLLASSFKVQLSDFDFSFLSVESLQAVFYRVSKEKAIVHHIINQASRYLSSNGSLYLAGYKQEGIKTYVDKASVCLGSVPDKQRGGKTSLLAHIKKTNSNGVPLDDKNYSSLRPLNEALNIKTKPGIFGWNKVDKGSEFLVGNVGDFFSSLAKPPERIADLGCGYGYIAVMANSILPAYYYATDNNVAAIMACKENFDLWAVQGDAVLDDCASEAGQLFDVVLCNPPFHQGFDIENDLTDKFLSSARRLLASGGKCFFVVNGFIPLEKKAAAYFSDITTFASNRSFKLIALGS